MRKLFNEFCVHFFGMLLLCSPGISLAGGYGNDPVSSLLQHLVDLLTDTWIRVIAVLAIATIGYMTISLGKIPRGAAISIVLGIAVVLGSAQLASMLGFAS